MAPSWANITAAARPCPPPEPVINATLSANRPGISISPHLTSAQTRLQCALTEHGEKHYTRLRLGLHLLTDYDECAIRYWTKKMKKSIGWAYLFFALSLFGLFGLHTIYLGKAAEGCLFSAGDLGRTLGPRPGAHSSFSEYPARHWSGAPKALSDFVLTIPLPEPAPGERATGAACSWGLVVD